MKNGGEVLQAENRGSLLPNGSNAIKKFVKINISYMEIYNENVNDLLNSENKNLEIREDRDQKSIFVQGLSKIEIKNPEEVLHYLEKGHDIRKIATNGINEKSSRSHTVFRFEV